MLVGHSYGGMVVSGVAEKMQERIASLVILDGFVPDDGKSMSDYWPSKLKIEWDVVAAKTGGLSIPPISADNFGVIEKRRAWVDQNCKPHPYASFNEKIRLNGGRERIANKLYIRATKWRSYAFDAFLKQLESDSTWRTIVLDCGHEVMVDQPERLAEILEEAL